MICMTFLSQTFSLTFKSNQRLGKKPHESKMKQTIFQLGTTPSSLMRKKIHFILPLPADWHELSCPSKVQPLLNAGTVIAVSQRGNCRWNFQIPLRVAFWEKLLNECF